jgi:hypothetical protein
MTNAVVRTYIIISTILSSLLEHRFFIIVWHIIIWLYYVKEYSTSININETSSIKHQYILLAIWPLSLKTPNTDNTELLTPVPLWAGLQIKPVAIYLSTTSKDTKGNYTTLCNFRMCDYFRVDFTFK